MQDIQSSAGGRIFAGGGEGGGGERRLRPHHHHHHLHGGVGVHHHHGQGPPQALKCPRCDSVNTKFCYYNNYNLSQPRHFCKNCRRYWTKGGVLRNVPVGGGCRKTKRSKQKHTSFAVPVDDPPPAQATTAAGISDADADAMTTTATAAADLNTSSRSSSDSSGLTATTAAAAGEAVSAASSASPSGFFNINDYKSMVMNAPPPEPATSHGFDSGLLDQTSGCGMFPDIGNFSNIMTSAAEQLPFGFGSVLDQNNQWCSQPHDHHQHDNKIHHQGGGGNIQSSLDGGGRFLHQMVQLDMLPGGLPGRPSSGNGNQAFGSLDWQPGADHGGLFGIPVSVDQPYWPGQNHQWPDDEDHQQGLYLP